MNRILKRPGSFRQSIAAICAFLVLANLSAWVWATLVFPHQPMLLGTALLAYGFGLRHAVDADHIAAIGNVTRKLMQAGKRPVGVGLFFDGPFDRRDPSRGRLMLGAYDWAFVTPIRKLYCATGQSRRDPADTRSSGRADAATAGVIRCCVPVLKQPSRNQICWRH
jgi:high-affinity nickel permease